MEEPSSPITIDPSGLSHQYIITINIAVTTAATTKVWKAESIFNLKLLYAKFSINLTHKETKAHAITIIINVSENLNPDREFMIFFYTEGKSTMDLSSFLPLPIFPHPIFLTFIFSSIPV